MANWYVRSGAAGTGTGADWTNAKTTLAATATASAAGDSIWVSEDHAETQASAMTITFPGTVASPSFVYCVNHAGTVPPVSADLRTTATVTTTGNFAITIAGSFYCYGIIFSSGSGANSVFFSVSNTSTAWARYDACALIAGGTSGGGILIGGNPSNMRLYWNNTTVQFAAAGSGIVWRSSLWVWENTASAVVSGTLPTTLLVSNSPGSGNAIWRGVDFSSLGAGKTLVPSLTAAAKVLISDCKLGASVTVAATPAAPGGTVVDLIRCDSGATNYRTERYRYEGTQTAETTIVRTGGASDGTTTLSQKIVTTANSKWVAAV
jgi:hypothetical protein